MQCNMLNDLAEAMKALDGKKMCVRAWRRAVGFWGGDNKSSCYQGQHWLWCSNDSSFVLCQAEHTLV
jgi:hypothetical protein